MVTVQVERRIVAPSIEVWRALSTPRGLALWQADEVDGEVAAGGQLQLRWPALGANMELSVVQFEAGSRVVLSDGDSQLKLELIAGGVRLTHELAAQEADPEGMTSSWRLALSQLAYSLERHPLCIRHCHWAARSLRVSAGTLYSMATEPKLAERWLWSGTVRQEGARVSLRLSDLSLSGRVLCHVPGHDLSIAWEEQGHSTLTLRTLPSPYSRDERIAALVWSEWEEPAAEPEAANSNEAALPSQPGTPVVAELDLAMERLAHLLSSSGQA